MAMKDIALSSGRYGSVTEEQFSSLVRVASLKYSCHTVCEAAL